MKSAVPLKRISNVATTLFLRKTFKKSKFLSCDSLSLSLSLSLSSLSRCPHTDLQVVPQNRHPTEYLPLSAREKKNKKKPTLSKTPHCSQFETPRGHSSYFSVRGFAEFSREGKKEERESMEMADLMTDFWKLKNWSNLQPPENRSKVEEGIRCFSWFPFNPY